MQNNKIMIIKKQIKQLRTIKPQKKSNFKLVRIFRKSIINRSLQINILINQ